MLGVCLLFTSALTLVLNDITTTRWQHSRPVTINIFFYSIILYTQHLEMIRWDYKTHPAWS